MADAQEQEDAPAAGQHVAREVKLPAFWPSRPAAWFRLAESRFWFRQVKDQSV